MMPAIILSRGACVGNRRRFDSTSPRNVAYAKKICRRCAFVAECTGAALGDRTLRGTWGALTAEEREQYRRVMRSPASSSSVNG